MSSFILKVFACIFMLIDHIGFALYPKFEILRAIGRLAFPIFAFQISIGYSKTHSKEKYILRMLLFTIISQVPFYLLRKVSLDTPVPLLNVGATLTCGLLAIYCIDKIKSPLLKYSSVICILLIAILVPMDYKWYGVLLIIIFYLFREDKLGIIVFYPILLATYCFYNKSYFHQSAIIALLPILLYNGKKGKNVKYLFYIFYPLHMLLLAFIKLYYFN